MLPAPKDMKQSRLRQKLSASQGFSLVELLVVIAIIGVLASLVVGLSGLAGRKSKEAKVRAELAQYITAIDRFKDHFGYYPPDHVRPDGTVDPVVNQLYYELAGIVVNNQTRSFQTSLGVLPATAVSMIFGPKREGFVNAAPDPKQVKSFVGNWKASQVKTVLLQGFNVQVLAAPVDFRKGDVRAPFPTPNNTVNPWRYVSTNPTNNPNSFDLWAEVPLGREIKIIGNWKE
jgi:prepilin-type N-terminal cleavage/methylation domain-containing protein